MLQYDSKKTHLELQSVHQEEHHATLNPFPHTHRTIAYVPWEKGEAWAEFKAHTNNGKHKSRRTTKAHQICK